MYINAQLDDNCYQKLESITQATRSSISVVIKQAIDFYYEHAKHTQISGPEQISRAERLLHSGFVGCGEAKPTLSENYKSSLLDVMEKQHDNG